MYTAQYRVFKIQVGFDHGNIDNYTRQLDNDLEMHLKRRFLQSNDEQQQRATLSKIGNKDILAFEKINLFSIAVFMGKSQALSMAASRFDMWM